MLRSDRAGSRRTNATHHTHHDTRISSCLVGKGGYSVLQTQGGPSGVTGRGGTSPAAMTSASLSLVRTAGRRFPPPQNQGLQITYLVGIVYSEAHPAHWRLEKATGLEILLFSPISVSIENSPNLLDNSNHCYPLAMFHPLSN